MSHPQTNNADSATPVRRIVPDPHSAMSAGVFLPTVNIITAGFSDFSAIDRLQAEGTNKVGFLARDVITGYLREAAIRIAVDHRDVLGYCLSPLPKRYPPQDVVRRIWQIVVAKSHHRRGIGTALLAPIIEESRELGFPGLHCRVARPLQANAFWLANGFVQICYHKVPNARRREIITYRLPLVRKLPKWFAFPQFCHNPESRNK